MLLSRRCTWRLSDSRQTLSFVTRLRQPMTDALLLSDPRFFQHRSTAYHPERPERLDAAHAAIERARSSAGLSFSAIEPRPATEEELLRVHDPRFLKWMSTLRGKDGYIDADTFVGPESVGV